MSRTIRFLGVFALLLLLTACNLPTTIDGEGPGQQPPTAPVVEETGEPAPTTEAPPTETPTEEPPTATSTPEPEPTDTEDLEPTDTPTPTVTVTSRVPTRAPATQPPASGGPLTIRGVTFVSAQRVAGTANDANATLSLEFRGGRAPYSLRNNEGLPTGGSSPNGTFTVDNVTWSFITFTERTSCGATLVKAVQITSADGQSARTDYAVQVVCP